MKAICSEIQKFDIILVTNLKIGPEPGCLAFDVVDKAAPEASGARQTGVLAQLLLVLLLVDGFDLATRAAARRLAARALGDGGGRLDANGGIPFARGQHCHRVQELVQSGHQVFAFARLVSHVVEDLVRHERRHRASYLVEARTSTLSASKIKFIRSPSK